MNRSQISVMRPGDKFKLWITYQADIYCTSAEQRRSGWWCIAGSARSCSARMDAFMASYRLVCLCHWAHKLLLPTWVCSRVHSGCGIQQQTETWDEKRPGWGLPDEELVALIRSSALPSSPCCDERRALNLLLLPSALAFVCCHGEAALILLPVAFLLILCPAKHRATLPHAPGDDATQTHRAECTYTDAPALISTLPTRRLSNMCEHGRTLSRERSQTWMLIYAATICRLTALRFGCSPSKWGDHLRPMWHRVTSAIAHSV